MARLRYLLDTVTEYTILRDEMTYTDDTGTTCTAMWCCIGCPKGAPSVCAAEFDAELPAVGASINWRRTVRAGLQPQQSQPATSTSPPDGSIDSVRYHFPPVSGEADTTPKDLNVCASFVREQGGKGQMLYDAETVPLHHAARIPVCSWAEMSDQLVRGRRNRLLGSSIRKTDRLSRRNSSGPPTSAKDAPVQTARAWA